MRPTDVRPLLQQHEVRILNGLVSRRAAFEAIRPRRGDAIRAAKTRARSWICASRDGACRR